VSTFRNVNNTIKYGCQAAILDLSKNLDGHHPHICQPTYIPNMSQIGQANSQM